MYIMDFMHDFIYSDSHMVIGFNMCHIDIVIVEIRKQMHIQIVVLNIFKEI